MDTQADQDTLFLLELDELLEIPLECEHHSHGDPDSGIYHDDEGAQWYLLGTHHCGRVTGIYACDTFVYTGRDGWFQIECSVCGEDGIPFVDFYKTMTRIKGK